MDASTRGGGLFPRPLPTVTALIVALILAVAAVARLWGIGFCFPHTHCRPDEDAISAIAGGFRAGNFHPEAFNYPALFMLAVAGVLRILPYAEQLLHKAAPFHFSPLLEGVTIAAKSYMVARLLSAAAGIASVWIIFRVGTRLFDRDAAIAAAGLLAVAFLHVRDSHFGVTDVPMSFMVLLAFAAAVRLMQSGTRKDLILAGVAAGLAASTKYNGGIVALPVLFAVLVCPRSAKPVHIRLAEAALAVLLMVIAFVGISPYTLLDFSHFAADLASDAQHLSGGHGVNLGRGWIYHATTTLRFGLGIPLLLAGVAGMLLALVSRPRTGVLIALFPVTYYAVLGSGYTVFTRHMTPIVPFLCLTGGYFVSQSAGCLAARLQRPQWRPVMLALIAFAVVWPSIQSVVRFDTLIARLDSRILARRWIEQRFPPGTTIAQLGPAGGHVYLSEESDLRYALVESLSRETAPELVVVQSSPVTGPPELGDFEPRLRQDYNLAYSRGVASGDPRNAYDMQDEFYLPLSGFHVERPGPNLEIYVRKDVLRIAPATIDRK